MLAHVALQILLPRANVKHCLRCLLQQLVTNAPIEQPITWDQCFLCHYAAPGFELLISGSAAEYSTTVLAPLYSSSLTVMYIGKVVCENAMGGTVAVLAVATLGEATQI